jgi:hypothetical protein
MNTFTISRGNNDENEVPGNPQVLSFLFIALKRVPRIEIIGREMFKTSIDLSRQLRETFSSLKK